MIAHAYDTHSAPGKGGANFIVEIDKTDLTESGAGTAQTFTFPVVAKQGVELVHAELPEAFVSSDGTLISTAVIVGDGGGTNRFLTSTELNAAGTEVFLKGGTNSTIPYVYTVDDTVDITITPTAAKSLNTHTAGKLRLFFRITDPRPGGTI